MPRPTSFRLPEELLERLDDEATSTGASATTLVATILDEGLKTRRFPGIVYRDGPTGRRAAVLGGPDVWEIIRALKQMPGKDERRVRALADQPRFLQHTSDWPSTSMGPIRARWRIASPPTIWPQNNSASASIAVNACFLREVAAGRDAPADRGPAAQRAGP